MINHIHDDDSNKCIVEHDGIKLTVERDSVYGDWYTLYSVAPVGVDDVKRYFTMAEGIYDLAYVRPTVSGWMETHITDDRFTELKYVEGVLFSKLVGKFRGSAIFTVGL